MTDADRFRLLLDRARIDVAADAHLTDAELAELVRVFTGRISLP